MKFRQALISYLFLALLTVALGLIAMPAELKLGVDQARICSMVPAPVRPGCLSMIPASVSRSVTLKRPPLHISLLGLTYDRDLTIPMGLDVQGGTQVVLLADMKDIPEGDRDRALESAREIIARRIDLYGVSESSVISAKTVDQYRIIAEIPGVKESDTAIQLIGSTAQLDFRELDPKLQASTSGLQIKDFLPTGITGKDLRRSDVTLDQKTNAPQISLEFSAEGTKKFADVTGRNLGKPIAIFIDEYPVTSPIVQSQITDGRATINGTFSIDQAKQLSVALNAGALPVPITVLEQRSIGATIGEQAVGNLVKASLLGISLVILFMVCLYGWKGVLSVVSLGFYALLTLCLYKLFPITLSLAGIAGFLLSLGMSVDTSILVFERLAEEERKGHRSPGAVVSTAFDRAWNSIKDANVTTLISAFILSNPFGWSFLNTSGVVRGFAVTLALGILLNLFTGMVVSRVLLTLFYQPPEES